MKPLLKLCYQFGHLRYILIVATVKIMAIAFEVASLAALIPIIGQNQSGKFYAGLAELMQSFSADYFSNLTDIRLGFLSLFLGCAFFYICLQKLSEILAQDCSKNFTESVIFKLNKANASLSPEHARYVSPSNLEHFINSEATHITKGVVNIIDTTVHTIVLGVNLVGLLYFSSVALNLTLLFFCLFALSYLVFSKKIQKESYILLSTSRETLKQATRFYRRLPMSILHAQATFEEAELNKRFQLISESELKLTKTRSTVSFIFEVLGIGYIAIFLGYCIYQQLNLGAAILFLTLFYRFSPKILQIQKSLIQLKIAEEAISSFHSLTADAQNVPRPTRELDHIQLENITLNNVSYATKDKEVLSNISMNFSTGRSYAILGPSGSGKTSLIDILLGLKTPTKGSLQINRHQFDEFSKESFYSQVALVSAEDFIVDASIKENILMGREFDPYKMEQATRISKLDEIIQKQKDGINTVISKTGFSGSQGERQRLLIARAIYSSPRYLILDEATNNLDPKTENDILSSLTNSLEDACLIVITHRPESVNWTDYVVRLESGQVISCEQQNSVMPDSVLIQ